MKKEYDSTFDTINHIRRVGELLDQVCQNLTNRAMIHDKSKLEEPEKSIFDKCTIRLKNIKYGSKEYYEALKELKPGLDHHYKSNSHHPEYKSNGINEMSLFDIFEMFVDWKSATERMKNGTGDIYKSIEINKKRFNISDQLEQILINTAKEMKWIK